MVNIIITYNDVFKSYADNLLNFRQMFETMNLQIAEEGSKYWKEFSKYTKNIN